MRYDRLVAYAEEHRISIDEAYRELIGEEGPLEEEEGL